MADQLFGLKGQRITAQGNALGLRYVNQATALGVLGHLAHLYVERHQAVSNYSSMGYDKFMFLDWHSAPVQFARYCGNFDGNFSKCTKIIAGHFRPS